MNDTVVTTLWMAGVMFIMLAYGVIAVVGFMRRAAKSPPP